MEVAGLVVTLYKLSAKIHLLYVILRTILQACQIFRLHKSITISNLIGTHFYVRKGFRKTSLFIKNKEAKLI